MSQRSDKIFFVSTETEYEFLNNTAPPKNNYIDAFGLKFLRFTCLVAQNISLMLNKSGGYNESLIMHFIHT